MLKLKKMGGREELKKRAWLFKPRQELVEVIFIESFVKMRRKVIALIRQEDSPVAPCPWAILN